MHEPDRSVAQDPDERRVDGPPPSDPPLRSRPRRWLRRAGFLLGSLLLLAALLYATRERTLHPLLTRGIAWAAPRFSDYDVRVGALHGDWWTTLALEDVSVSPRTDDAPLRALALDRAAVELRMGSLLRGSLAGVRAVRLGRGEVALRLAGGGADETSEPQGGASLPDELPVVSVEGLDVTVDLADGARLVTRDTALAPRADGATFLTSTVRWTQEGGLDVHGALEAEAALRDGALALRALRVGDLLRDGAGEVGLADGLRVELRGALPNGGSLAAFLARRGDPLRARAELAAVDLAATVAAVADLGLPTPALETLAGTADLEAALVAPAPDGAAFEVEVRRLAGRDVRYDGRAVDELALAGDLDGGGARVAALHARAGAQTLAIEEARIPFADLDAFLAGLAGRVDLELDDLPAWLRGTTDEEVPPHHLALRAHFEGGRLLLDDGRLDVAGGGVAIRAGTLDLLPQPDERRIDLDLAAELPDLGAVGALLGRADWSGAVRGDVRLSGPLARPLGHANLAGEGVRVEQVELGAVALEATSDGRTIDVARLDARSPWGHVTGAGGYALDAAALRDVDLDVELDGWDALGLAVEGRLAGTLKVDGPLGAPDGRLELVGDGVVVAGTRLDDLALAARAQDGALEVERLAARTPYGDVEAAGRWDAPAVLLSTLRIARDDRDLALARPARIELADGGGVVLPEPLELAGSAGRASVAGEWSGGRWTAQVTTEALAPGAFLAALLPPGAALEGIDADVRAAGPGPDGPLQDLQANVSVARLAASDRVPPLALALEGGWKDGRATLARLAALVDGQPALEARGTAPLSATGALLDGPLELDAAVHLQADRPLALPIPAPPSGEGEDPAQAVALAAQAEGKLALRGTWSAPTGTLELDARQLTFTPASLAGPWLAAPADLALRASLEDRVVLERFSLSAPERAEIAAHGTLDARPDLARLAAGDASGFADAALALDVELHARDLAWAGQLTEALRRVAGTVDADLHLGGTLSAPQPEGTLHLADGALKAGTSPELSALSAEVAWSGGAVELRDVRGELGASPFRIGGQVGWTADGPALDLTLAGENLLLQRTSDLRLRGDVDLRLRGALDQLELSGAVHLANSHVLQQVDFLSLLQPGGGGVDSAQSGIVLPSFRDAPLSTTRFDVSLDTREPVRLAGNVARGELTLDLHLGGTGEVLVPTGTVFLDTVRVALPGGTMRFDRGLVTLEEENPYVPRLDLNGEARLSGYDVTMNVSGPLDDPQIDPTANPPLPRRDVWLLVMTGRVPPSGEATRSTAQALGMYLAKDLARRWASSPGLSEEESLLDRLEVVSGQDVSRSGVMTIEVSYRAWDDLFGEKDDDAVFVVGERDVYEDYNIGLRFLFRGR